MMEYDAYVERENDDNMPEKELSPTEACIFFGFIATMWNMFYEAIKLKNN